MVNHRHAFLKLFSASRNLSLNGQATPTEFPLLRVIFSSGLIRAT